MSTPTEAMIRAASKRSPSHKRAHRSVYDITYCDPLMASCMLAHHGEVCHSCGYNVDWFWCEVWLWVSGETEHVVYVSPGDHSSMIAKRDSMEPVEYDERLRAMWSSLATSTHNTVLDHVRSHLL